MNYMKQKNKKNETFDPLTQMEELRQSPCITRIIQEINMFSLIKKEDKYYFDFDKMDNVKLSPVAKEQMSTAYLKENQHGLYRDDDIYLFDNIEILTIFYGKTEEEAVELLKDAEQRYNPKPLPYMTETPKISEDNIKYLVDSVMLNSKINKNAEKDKFFRFITKSVIVTAAIFFVTVCITKILQLIYMDSSIFIDFLTKFVS